MKGGKRKEKTQGKELPFDSAQIMFKPDTRRQTCQSIIGTKVNVQPQKRATSSSLTLCLSQMVGQRFKGHIGNLGHMLGIVKGPSPNRDGFKGNPRGNQALGSALSFIHATYVYGSKLNHQELDRKMDAHF